MKQLKVVSISDTHNKHKKIKSLQGPIDADVIVHAGDATGRGEMWELEHFMEWFGGLPVKYKIFVPGNHDWACETRPKEVEELAKEFGVIILNDSGIEIEGVKFWGSPITPWFYSWAFNRRRTLEEDAAFGGGWVKDHWDKIPEGTDVLITHGPPRYILDELVYVTGDPKGEFVGCDYLAIAVKRIKPQVHVFGHIHCGYGEKHEDGISYYNSAVCDEMYMPTNEPHTFVVEKKDP